MLRIANLTLLILFPIAWFAPLMRAGLLPLFGLGEISVISGLQSLWGSDVFLALLVTFFALFAPYTKTIGLALIHFGYLRRKVDEPFGRHDIETVRGGGYRLADPRSVGIPGSTP